MAEKEIQRGIDNGHHPTQRLGNLIEVQSVSSDNFYWEFKYDGIVHEVKTPHGFTKVLEDVLATRKGLIGNNLTVEEVRDCLTELGYISHTSAIAPYQASAPIDPHAIVSSWEVNGELIRQRADGKIDATAMCRAYHKVLGDWIRTDDTWQLFIARAEELEISWNLIDSSIKTRVASSFPTLIERKSGQPERGGGTWMDHKLVIHLAQWLDKKFALMVSDIVEEWMKNN